MAEKMFPGQNDEERVLYVVHQHALGTWVRTSLVVGIVFAVWVISYFARNLTPLFGVLGFVVGVGVGVAGIWFVLRIAEWSRAYITDRRIVRFDAATPFNWTSRSLNWDDTLKVKTFAPNVFWKLLKVGKVVVHSKSTMVGVAEAPKGWLTNDDLDIDYVYYYHDLGNYIDKILYCYKHNREELAAIRPFVPKPKWKRY